MAEKSGSEVVNSGEQIGPPPTGLGVSSDTQYRMLAARLEEVAGEVGKLAKPPAFRIADMLEIAVDVAQSVASREVLGAVQFYLATAAGDGSAADDEELAKALQEGEDTEGGGE